MNAVPRLPRANETPRNSGIYLTAILRPAPRRASGMPVAVFVILFACFYAITSWVLAVVR